MAVHVFVPADQGQNRLWGILWFGIFVRTILVIPQLVILAILGFVAYLIVLVSWIPVLVMGRQATAIVNVMTSILRLQLRVSLYVGLISGRYPWFNTAPDLADVGIDPDESQNRLWGIPIVGIVVRAILAIPHLLILWLLGIAVGFLFIVIWVPVLVNGRQATSIVDFVAGTYRYSLRVAAYLLLLTGEYPPFRLGEVPAAAPPAPVEQPAV